MSKLSGARPASVAPPAAIDRIASTRPAVRDPDIPTLSAALDPVELARFHSLSPLSGPVRSVDKILARSLRAAGVVSEKGGLLANKAERLFDGLKAHASNLPTTPLRAGHGDFGSYHIVFADARTVTIDWDLYDLADPARDV